MALLNVFKTVIAGYSMGKLLDVFNAYEYGDYIKTMTYIVVAMQVIVIVLPVITGFCTGVQIIADALVIIGNAFAKIVKVASFGKIR